MAAVTLNRVFYSIKSRELNGTSHSCAMDTDMFIIYQQITTMLPFLTDTWQREHHQTNHANRSPGKWIGTPPTWSDKDVGYRQQGGVASRIVSVFLPGQTGKIEFDCGNRHHINIKFD